MKFNTFETVQLSIEYVVMTACRTFAETIWPKGSKRLLRPSSSKSVGRWKTKRLREDPGRGVKKNFQCWILYIEKNKKNKKNKKKKKGQ